MAEAKKKNPIPRLSTEDLEIIMTPRPKSGPGAKIVLDQRQLDQIEIMSGLGMKMTDISLVLGFSDTTLYNMCDRDERVLVAIKTGKAKAIAAVTQTAYQLAKGGKHPAMTMFWLKCQQRWREVHPEDNKQTHEVVFRTKIGDKGQLLTEQSEDAKSDDKDEY